MGATAILIIDGLIDSGCLRVTRRAAEPYMQSCACRYSGQTLHWGEDKSLYHISDEWGCSKWPLICAKTRSV